MRIIKILKILKNNPRKSMEYLTRKTITRFLFSDKQAISFLYWLRFNKKINLKTPETFNEKLLWLTLYDRRAIQNTIVDKAEAKDYIRKKLEAASISANCIIPTIGVFDKFDEIDFSVLPSKFVMKTTHDSGGVVICDDKNSLNIPAVKASIEKKLNCNYYWYSREWAYKDVKPRIIIEKKIDSLGTVPDDYKIFCFDGKAKYWCLCSNRDKGNSQITFDYYDMTGHLLPFMAVHKNSNRGDVKLPECWAEMVRCAEILSQEFPHLRVDFYVDSRSVFYIGELTLTHAGGLSPFSPPEYDKICGQYINLPK